MIDVFLRWHPLSTLRLAMAETVFERLQLFKGIRLYVLEPADTPTANIYCFIRYNHKPIKVPEPFHINSKRVAEKLAESEIYCVIDDDQVPINKDFFQLGIEALGNNPDFGMLTARLVIEHQLAPGGYSPMTDVYEVHSIGCPYFVRKGTLSFPQGAKEQYDGILSKVVTDKGLKTGIANRCLVNHIGYGFSQIVPEHWGA